MASEFLAEMEKNGVQPNRVTFQHLVGKQRTLYIYAVFADLEPVGSGRFWSGPVRIQNTLLGFGAGSGSDLFDKNFEQFLILSLKAVFRIRIHRIHMFSGLPDPDPLVRGMDPDPDPSIIMQK